VWSWISLAGKQSRREERRAVGVTGVVQQNYWGLCGENVRVYWNILLWVKHQAQPRCVEHGEVFKEARKGVGSSGSGSGTWAGCDREVGWEAGLGCEREKW
jgi:hypothetical protein